MTGERTEVLDMASATLKQQPDDKPDRRKLRSVRSNQKILNALVTLIRSGNFTPRAQDIARVSGLSLRTVFRHIEDMESLYRELTTQMEQKLLPHLQRPYTSQDWREQLSEMIQRRVVAFEEMLPLRTAADQKRFQSDVLQQDYLRVNELQRTLLIEVLPLAILGDPDLLDAMDMTVSFATWRRLRYDQGISTEAAERVVRRTVSALIRDVE